MDGRRGEGGGNLHRHPAWAASRLYRRTFAQSPLEAGRYRLSAPDDTGSSSEMVKTRLMRARRDKVLAVASGGGHWIQLLRLRAAFDGAQVVFVTVNPDYREQVPDDRVHIINDATRWNKFALALMALRLLFIILRERPTSIVTTGAAPGYFAIRFGRWLGARTVWLDSIANVDELSMSGKLASRHADVCLTQWPHLAGDDGIRFEGAVL